MTAELRIAPLGDAALLAELPQRIDPIVNATAIALADAVERRCGGALRDVVVGYASVTVYFDPRIVDRSWIQGEVEAAAEHLAAEPSVEGPLLDVPVRYGGSDGPDLTGVAAFAQCSEEEVIRLHSGRIYRVYMLGFLPGFAYMAEVSPRLAMPRRSQPRTLVPAGSVAIAGGQTAIYPTEAPGGWHLIGRTSVKPYDPSRGDPFLFKPGDRVRFTPVRADSGGPP